MIATIIIVGLALGWLGHESHWLTIRLAIGESIEDYDKRIPGAMIMPANVEEDIFEPASGYYHKAPKVQGIAERLYAESNKVELLSRFGRETTIQIQAKRFLERG